jgi:hypothetical protein
MLNAAHITAHALSLHASHATDLSLQCSISTGTAMKMPQKSSLQGAAFARQLYNTNTATPTAQ